MKEVIVKVSEITKIRKFKDNTVVYTPNTCWVCKSTQRIPNADDVFLTLDLATREDGGENER